MAWKDVKPAEKNENLPDGKYQGIISGVGIKQTRADGTDYLGARIDILSPNEYRKRVMFKNWMYNNEKAQPYVKADWLLLDIDIADLAELNDEETLYKFVGNVVDITLKSNGPNQNVYINKFVKRYEPNMVEDVLNDLGSTYSPDDDDIPF